MGLTTKDNLASKLNLASVGKPVVAGAVALVVMVAVVAGRMMIDTATANVFEVEPARDNLAQTQDDGQADPDTRIFVHVTGCVVHPGLVELEAGARVVDAVDAAGGLADDAASDAVNLARPVQDGEQLQVPSVEQVEERSAEQPDSPAQGESSDVLTSSQGGLVNINTAGSTELQSLPGVGAATAAKIVDYRTTNGPFRSCEEIKLVSGIGDKKYEALADLICV